jgi:psiF repeat
MPEAHVSIAAGNEPHATSHRSNPMKHLMTVLALSVACLSTPAFATSHKEAPDMAKGASAPMGKQQSKMGECNKDAGDKKGDERKAFMKTCLSAKKAGQQDKMKACNADPKAKATKGDERKAFMKECLSK